MTKCFECGKEESPSVLPDISSSSVLIRKSIAVTLTVRMCLGCRNKLLARGKTPQSACYLLLCDMTWKVFGTLKEG